MTTDLPIILKLLLLGDSTVGKTCFLMRFTENTFQEGYMSTIGLDYRLKDMQLNDNKTMVKVQIWDTAGQDRFRAITKNYYKGADGIILMYDVTNPLSFKNITQWIEHIKENASKQVKIIIIGNKIDIEDSIQIQSEELEKLASSYQLKAFQTSAKNNVNINECFSTLVNDIYNYNIFDNKNKGKSLGRRSKKKRKWC